MKKIRNRSGQTDIEEMTRSFFEKSVSDVLQKLGYNPTDSNDEKERIMNIYDNGIKLEKIKKGNYNTLVVNPNGEAFVFNFDATTMPEVFGFMEYSGGKGTFSKEIQVSNEDYEVLKEILQRNGINVIEIPLDAVIDKNSNEYKSLTKNPTEDHVFKPVDVKTATEISEEKLKEELKEAGATDEIVNKVIDMIYMAYSGSYGYDNIFIKNALEQGEYKRLISLAMSHSVEESTQYHNLANGVRRVMMKAQEKST